MSSLAPAPYITAIAKAAVIDACAERITAALVALIDQGLTIEQAEVRMKAAFREAVSRRIEKAVQQGWCA